MQDTRLGEELVGQFRHLRPDINDDHALMRTYPRALFFQSTLQRIRTQRPRASISFAPASPISVTGFLYLPTSRRLPLSAINAFAFMTERLRLVALQITDDEEIPF